MAKKNQVTYIERNIKKWDLAHICAYFSLVISITILVLWSCNAGGFTVVSLDSFVGVIVALLAIVVTLVLGWQIYNSIELKTKIELLDNLRNKLDIQEKEIESQSNMMSHLIFAALSDVEISRRNYTLAFLYLTRSLGYSMSLDKPMNTDAILPRMKKVITEIKKAPGYNKNISLSSMEKEAIQSNDKIIRESQCYNLIQSQYVEIYEDFFSKVKEE